MHHLHHHRRPSAAADASGRGLLPVLLIAQLMVILDISAVNVALPDLARDLRIGPSEIGWTITSYSLLFGSLLLLGGRAADLLGRRRVFFTGLTVFTASSLASALAVSSASLFAARAGQGLGAAMLSPAALSIITSSYRGSERARALGAWGAVGGAGGAIGVLLGGVLTQVADWRAIFYINLPVALAVAVVGRHVVPADQRTPRWRGLDLRGAAVATTSLAALVYALTQAAANGWTSARTFSFGLAGLAGLAAFVILERHAAMPLLRVQRLRDRAVGGGFTLMLVASAVMFGTFVTSSLYLQGVLGKGPLATGLYFLPLAVATAAGAHVGVKLVSRLGVRLPMAVALATIAAGELLLAGVDRAGSYAADVLPGMIIAGAGLGVVMTSIGVSVLSGARDDEAGMLSGLNTTGHEIGGTLGIAALVTVATAGAGSGLGAVGVTGIDHAFLATGAVAACGSLLASLVLPPARSFLPKLRLSPSPMPIH
ncbi:MAG TPA: MFS transporter [Gaiellaceae bacterium]|nr:MFS transporter [Gaiellaceae bacterium]